jgi:hypothetical protein
MSTKQRLYQELFERQNGLCASCDCELVDRYTTQIDRIIPGKDGGQYVIDNCRLICLPCDWKKEGNKPRSKYPELASAYRTYKMWQTMHGSMDRKIRAFTGDIAGTTRSPYIDGFTLQEIIDLKDYFKDQEKMSQKRVKHLVRETPEWIAFLKDAPGCAEILAAHLLSRVDIGKAENVSSLWRFFGFDPANAAGQKGRNPGLGSERAPIYAALSISVCTRTDSEYRKIYDTYRGRDVSHGGALLRTIKLWLSHLWSAWREFEELPVTVPYANNHLGHDGFYDRKEFGWK